jgi:hypothetical protein
VNRVQEPVGAVEIRFEDQTIQLELERCACCLNRVAGEETSPSTANPRF